MPSSDDRAGSRIPGHASNDGTACRTPSSVSSGLSIGRTLALLLLLGLRLLLVLLLLGLLLLGLRLLLCLR
jgi:hypothetical protein